MGCSPSCFTEDGEDDSYNNDNKLISYKGINKYRLSDELGKGAFSVVRKAIDNETGAYVAIKCVSRAQLTENDIRSFKQEVEILKRVQHRNIIKFLDFFEDDDCYYLVMEYMAGGELFERIVQNTCYNEDDARNLIISLLNAVKYCHDHNIVHRDLKPENLLLSSIDDNADIKLADFGFATSLDGANLTTQCGTPNYVAPEILNKQRYGKAVDMWAVGVITFILLGGYPPFDDDDQNVLYRKIKAAEFSFDLDYWSLVSEEAKDFIRRLIVVDVQSRMTADMAMTHVWLRTDPKVLQTRHLESNLAALRRYSARRKLKAAVRVIIATQRMKSNMSFSSHSRNVSSQSSGILLVSASASGSMDELRFSSCAGPS